jgi:hypothetical protein
MTKPSTVQKAETIVNHTENPKMMGFGCIRYEALKK